MVSVTIADAEVLAVFAEPSVPTVVMEIVVSTSVVLISVLAIDDVLKYNSVVLVLSVSNLLVTIDTPLVGSSLLVEYGVSEPTWVVLDRSVVLTEVVALDVVSGVNSVVLSVVFSVFSVELISVVDDASFVAVALPSVFDASSVVLS